MGTNTHTRVKEAVQKYLTSFKRFQEEFISFKEFRVEINQPLELTIDISETKDEMEAIRRYEARLKRGLEDPTGFVLTKMVFDVFFEMKKDLEKLFHELIFPEGRKCKNLDDLVSYSISELHDLEAKLYSKNMDELECFVCGLSHLILDEGRAEQTCRNCGIVIQDKISEEDISKLKET